MPLVYTSAVDLHIFSYIHLQCILSVFHSTKLHTVRCTMAWDVKVLLHISVYCPVHLSILLSTFQYIAQYISVYCPVHLSIIDQYNCSLHLSILLSHSSLLPSTFSILLSTSIYYPVNSSILLSTFQYIPQYIPVYCSVYSQVHPSIFPSTSPVLLSILFSMLLSTRTLFPLSCSTEGCLHLCQHSGVSLHSLPQGAARDQVWLWIPAAVHLQCPTRVRCVEKEKGRDGLDWWSVW